MSRGWVGRGGERPSVAWLGYAVAAFLGPVTSGEEPSATEPDDLSRLRRSQAGALSISDSPQEKDRVGLLDWAAQSESEATEEVNNGQDITKPLTRFDLRFQYQNLAGENDAFIVTPRVDKPFVLAESWQLATRFDLPVVYNDVVSPDNADGEGDWGVGDSLLQGLLIHSIDEKNAWAAGTQLIFPTGTEDQFGAGKWQLVPTLAYRYALPEITPGSFFAGLARYQFDFAGDEDREDISRLQVAPIFNFNLPENWFVTLWGSGDITYDFEAEDWFIPADVMIGKMLAPGIVGSVEFEVPIVDDLPLYDFKVEFRIGFFF